MFVFLLERLPPTGQVDGCQFRTVAAEAVDGDGGLLRGHPAARLRRPVGRPAHRQRRVSAQQVDVPPRRVGDGQERAGGVDHRQTAAGQRGGAPPSAGVQKGQGFRRDARHQLPHARGMYIHHIGHVPPRHLLIFDL